MSTLTSRTLLSMIAVVAIASAGCGDPPVTTAPSGSAAKPATSVAAPSKASAAPTGAASVAMPEPMADEILTEADFEVEAEKDITADNMEAELASLEKDIEEAK